MQIPPEQSKNGIVFVGFNQNQTCLSVGSRNGFYIWRAYPFGKCFGGMHDGSIKIVEMLFSTSLVAIVGVGDQPDFSPRKLHLWNTKSCTSICDLTFLSPIQGVKMNQQRLVVVLENKIHVYNLERVEVIFSLDIIDDGARPAADAVPTPLIPGLAALSPSTNFLAYPCSTTRGAVMLVDTSPPPTPVPAAAGAAAIPTAAPAPGRKHLIVAHENPVVALCFNQQGNMLATASAKGTCIRVWSVPEGDQIAEFRRSSGKRAHIYSLCFSLDSSLLAATADSGTVHIFAMEGRSRGAKAFAYCRLKEPQPSIACFSPDNQYVHIAVAEGVFQRWRLPPVHSSGSKKDCTFEEVYSLADGTTTGAATPGAAAAAAAAAPH